MPIQKISVLLHPYTGSNGHRSAQTIKRESGERPELSP